MQEAGSEFDAVGLMDNELGQAGEMQGVRVFVHVFEIDLL